MTKAVTIAIRYSTVRRQSPINPHEPEPKVLEHVTQQFKIFPILAKAIVIKLSAEYLWDMYNHVTAELDKGDMERLPELHSVLIHNFKRQTNTINYNFFKGRLLFESSLYKHRG